MTPGAKAIAALGIACIVGLAGGFMYLVTTFLFNFSGGQAKMGPVVGYGALTVIAATILVAIVVWKVRSPLAAVIAAVVATPIAWFMVVFMEWGFSQFVFVTGAP
jgi:hypothetical protein